jgi:hypothetical protein
MSAREYEMEQKLLKSDIHERMTTMRSDVMSTILQHHKELESTTEKQLTAIRMELMSAFKTSQFLQRTS